VKTGCGGAWDALGACTWSKRRSGCASELMRSARGFVPGAGVSAAMRSVSSCTIAASSMLRFPFFLRGPLL